MIPSCWCSIQYLIKKGKKGAIKFQRDDKVKTPTMKNGTVLVPQGMPKDSRNMQSASAAPLKKATPQQSRGPAGGNRGPPPQQQQQQQQAYQPPPQQQQAYQPPQQQQAPRAPGPAAPGGFGGARPGAAPGGFGGRPSPRPAGAAAPQAAAPAGGYSAPPSAVGAGGRPAPRPPGAGPGRPAPPAAKPNLPKCKALYAYAATEADELTLDAGDVITITSKDNEGWWEGTSKGRKGLFPANYVEMI